MAALSSTSSSSTLIIRHFFNKSPSLPLLLNHPVPILSFPIRRFFPPFLSSFPPIRSLSSANPQTLIPQNNFTPKIGNTQIAESDINDVNLNSVKKSDQLASNLPQPLISETETLISDDDFEPEIEETRMDESGVSDVDLKTVKKYEEMVSNLPSLSGKEKKELASYAHSLGKKLKSQQVGKSGITDSVAIALVETLEANELLKVKIHSNSPVELDDAVKQLEGATGSVVVGRIGRTVILYRPSLTKLKAEEKKIQARKIFVRRQQTFKSSLQNKAKAFTQSGSRRERSRS